MTIYGQKYKKVPLNVIAFIAFKNMGGKPLEIALLYPFVLSHFPGLSGQKCAYERKMCVEKNIRTCVSKSFARLEDGIPSIKNPTKWYLLEDKVGHFLSEVQSCFPGGVYHADLLYIMQTQDLGRVQSILSGGWGPSGANGEPLPVQLQVALLASKEERKRKALTTRVESKKQKQMPCDFVPQIAPQAQMHQNPVWSYQMQPHQFTHQQWIEQSYWHQPQPFGNGFVPQFAPVTQEHVYHVQNVIPEQQPVPQPEPVEQPQPEPIEQPQPAPSKPQPDQVASPIPEVVHPTTKAPERPKEAQKQVISEKQRMPQVRPVRRPATLPVDNELAAKMKRESEEFEEEFQKENARRFREALRELDSFVEVSPRPPAPVEELALPDDDDSVYDSDEDDDSDDEEDRRNEEFVLAAPNKPDEISSDWSDDSDDDWNDLQI